MAIVVAQESTPALAAVQVRPGTSPGTEPDFTQSGNLQIGLPSLPAGSRVTDARLRVTGTAFSGLLKNLSGVNVKVSPVVYNSDGNPDSSSTTQQAFIVDFTGIRTLMRLVMKSGRVITLVLPWLGTAFSNKSAFPPPGEIGTIPDGTGSSSVAFAGIETTKVLVQIIRQGPALTADAFSSDCRVVTNTFPSNLKASINTRQPFFTRPGVLNGSTDVIGIAEDWNALLSAGAPAPVTLTIATDTPGVLQTDFDPAHDVDTERSDIARFGGQASQDVDANALETLSVPVVFPGTPAGAWELSRLQLDFNGQFPPWRAFSAQGSDAPGVLGLRVDAKFSVARKFPFAQAGDLFGFSLLFRAPGEAAQLRLEVVADKSGQPGPGPAVAAADLNVPTGAAGTFGWINALFASAVKITPDQKLWLTLRAKTGSVEWAGSASGSAETTTLLNNEGGAWQAYPPINGHSVVGLARVLRKPFAQENQPLISLAFQSGAASADLVSGSASVEISFPKANGPRVSSTGDGLSLLLDVTARAAGKLSIRKAQIFYREAAL